LPAAQTRDKTAVTENQFAKVIDDLPLMPGLEPVDDEDVLFVAPDRERIAITHAEGEVDIDEVYHFYQKSLPQLGWKQVDARTYSREGEQLRIGALAFDVLHCPGHTPGHVVFVEQTRRFAILGDVLFRGSVGRTDFPYGDHAALIGAIRGKLLPLGDDIAFICGHGEGSTLGIERRTNPFLQEDADAA